MQYIHRNKRPYIHGGAVKRQDIFIWFITLFHLIHEQLAAGDRGERGRLVLSSLTLRSMVATLRGKRRREGGREGGKGGEKGRDKQWVAMPSPWELLVSKYICWTQQRHTLVVSYIGRTQHNMQKEKGEALDYNGVQTGCCVRDVLYNKLYIMLNTAWYRTIGVKEKKKKK